jgi:hypothetical protein
MTEKRYFDFKFIEIFAQHNGSIGIASRRKMFNLRTNIKLVVGTRSLEVFQQ